jgi:hypothetical protein
VHEVPLYTGDLEADVGVVRRQKLADQITGGLSITQKMPCPSWGISATRCQLGSLLAEKPGTVCNDCYALKGRYRFKNVQAKLEERYQGLFNPLWTPAMVYLIRWHCDRYFRPFDSGDLQGENHLRNIVTIAQAVPDVQMWLPTREAELVRRVGQFPPNLTVRLSAHQIDGKPPDWPTSSVVATRSAPAGSYACPSRAQGNSCRDCRECWDQGQEIIAYKLH